MLPVFSQHSCKNNHQLIYDQQIYHDNQWFKSAYDNLRSDTLNILNYSIYLDFTQSGSQQITGVSTISFEALMATNSISLDLLQMNIDSITHDFDGQLNFTYNDTLIIVELTSTLAQGASDSIKVYYHGSPQQDASGWGGFYFQGNYSYNLGVGFAADPHNYGRAWHPCFDNFAERATYRFEVLTNNGNTAYCNGERQNVNVVGTDSLLTTWIMNDPIPSYLASVAVAPYTHAELTYSSPFTSTTTPVWLIAEAADTNNMKSSFINVTGAIQAFESSYGNHAWNKVGFVLVPFNSGAMEHATNIAFPAATATGSLLYETLMAHELAHHWWGDLVTCRTEEEMWINEGMASYSERIFLENVYDRDRYMAEVRDNHHRVLHLAHVIDSGYYALNAVPHGYTYGEHSYNKGSDVAHTMRGYFGDSLFFVGLQSVMNNFAGGNLSSIEFRDHLNTINGINANDFFDAWILNPGFSNFSIHDFTVSGSGPYTVDVVIDQKLKATANFHNNVPLQIRFMDENWNVHNEEILMSGDFDLFSFQIPFEPTFVAVNMDERINDAVTAVTEIISTTGLKDMPYANSRLTVSNITDSCLVRIEHHWVYPDFHFGIPPNVTISPQRYWSVMAINESNLDATLRFDFNGQLNNAGYYDQDLLIDYGSELFTEDSIVLLYRPDDKSAWTIHPDYNLQSQGSKTDKKGIAIANIFMQGQYTWGYKTNSLSIADIEKGKFQVYPNPANDLLIFNLDNYGAVNYQVTVRDIQGKTVLESNLMSQGSIDISSLNNGQYIITVQAEGEMIGSKVITVQR